MPLGPIFERELVVSARRGVTYRTRVWVGLVVLFVLYCNDYFWREYSPGPLSPRGVRSFCQSLFVSLVALQIVATLGLVPGLLGPSIAAEKKRKTIHYLLASRLTSREIILGKLGSRLAAYLAALLVALPFQWGLCELGGIRWYWTLLAYGATLSLAYVLAGLTMLASTIARDTRDVTRWTGGIVGFWLMGPVLIDLLIGSLWPPVTTLIQQASHYLLAPCSPMMALFRIRIYLGAGGLGRLEEDVLTMMAYQVVYGTLFLALAILLLRPLYRRQADGDGGFLRIRAPRARRRPPIGEDALLWRERYLAKRTRGFAFWLGMVISLAMLAGLAYSTYRFAAPCFAHPAGSAELAAGQTQFNIYLRTLTLILVFLSALLGASITSVSITSEREADTWDALVATPLEGREILRAKVMGPLLRSWPLPAVLVALWILGVVAGAVHPLGWFFALIGLGVAGGFAVVVGVVVSLIARDSAKASGWATAAQLVPIVMLPMLFLLPSAWTPAWFRPSPWMAAPSVPLITAGLLFRPIEIQNALDPAETTRWINLTPGAGPISRAELLLTAIIGLGSFAAASVVLMRWGVANFDRLVGRPVPRTTKTAEPETPANVLAPA